MKKSVILVSSQFFGNGDEALGEVLLENYFMLLKQNEQKPAAIFFIHSGVLALTERSLASLHIKELAHQGIPIYACKTCVEYYGIEDTLTTGEISTMKHFIELSNQYNVITIS